MAIALNSSDASTVDNFFTGSEPVETTEVTFTTGQVLVAREVVAINTTTGQAVTYTEGGATGTGVAVFITAYAVDATGADTAGQVYKKGTFNPDDIVWSGTPTQAQKDSAFAGTPISLQSAQV